MTFNWKYCLFALALLLSCSDNPRLDYPSEESLFPKANGSAGSSSSVEDSSSSSTAESSSSNLEIDDSSSSAAGSSSSTEENTSSSTTESSSSNLEIDDSSSSAAGSSSSAEESSSSSTLESSSSGSETAGSSSSAGGSSSTEESSSSYYKENSSSSTETDVSSSSESGNSTESSSSNEPSSSSVVLSSSSEFLCGETPYDFDTEFCYNNSKIGSLCGANPQKSYNPELYECKLDINPNGIYLISGVGSYNAVLIGSQTWMAANLNNNTRYYWSAAMNLPQSYDTYPYQGSGRERGICPSGWHLPSSSEWTTLKNFINNSAGTNVSAVKLKATSGWESSNGTSSNGTDDYGFTALSQVNNCWWSSTGDYVYNAYYWGMDNSEDTYVRSRDKSTYCSVRCLKD